MLPALWQMRTYLMQMWTYPTLTTLALQRQWPWWITCCARRRVNCFVTKVYVDILNCVSPSIFRTNHLELALCSLIFHSQIVWITGMKLDGYSIARCRPVEPTQAAAKTKPAKPVSAAKQVSAAKTTPATTATRSCVSSACAGHSVIANKRTGGTNSPSSATAPSPRWQNASEGAYEGSQRAGLYCQLCPLA